MSSFFNRKREMDQSAVRFPSARSSMHASLHPLVIINISEHWTRIRAQQEYEGPTKVCGVLIGRRVGRTVDVVNAFELVLETTADDRLWFLDEHFHCRAKQYKEMFEEVDVIGWYCTGNDEETDEAEIELYRQFTGLIELPFVLKLNAMKDTVASKLPIVMYESVLDASTGSHDLYKLDWSIVSEDSERIGVDHVTRYSTNSNSANESMPAKHLKSHVSAVEMLLARVAMMSTYLHAVIEGKLPANPVILREFRKMCDALRQLQASCAEDKGIAHIDVTATHLLSRLSMAGAEFAQLLHRVNQIANERSMALLSSSRSSDRDSPLLSTRKGLIGQPRNYAPGYLSLSEFYHS